MACIPAPSLKEMFAELNQLCPNRSRASDGICASATHSSQNSASDHERGDAGDITHDPANGCDAHALVEGLKFRQDPRIKYIISQGRIWNPSISLQWRPYSGSNPHNKHAHISILPTARNDLSRWFPSPTPQPISLEESEEGDDMPTARVYRNGNRIDLYVIGKEDPDTPEAENRIFHRSSNDGGETWNPSGPDNYEDLGGLAKQIISASDKHVLIIGMDDGVHQNRFTNKWTGWVRLGGKVA